MAFLDLTCASVAENLAVDEALLIEADAGRGQPTLRFWEPADFTVVLGASCRLGVDVRLEECLADLVPVVRRTSGGGTVVVGPGTLNVSVILPDSAGPGLDTVEGAHQHVLEWLAAAIRPAAPKIALDGRGDLVVDGRKCGGSAQRRLRSWFMVHCSILCDFPIERIERYLTIPRRQPEYRQGRKHRDFLRNLGVPHTILKDAIRGDCPAAGVSPSGQVVPEDVVERLLSEKFANQAWIERF
jgi:lipoate-protein ligase A